MEQGADEVVASVPEPECDAAQMLESAIDRFRGAVRGSGIIEVGQDIGPAALERCPQAAQLVQLVRDR